MKNTYKKKIFYGLIFCVFAPHVGNAQISSKVTNKYPASVVYRLYQITLKAEISDEKQLTLAQYFFRQDSLANQALKNSGGFQTAMNYYKVNAEYLKSVLSPLEFNDYQFTTSNVTSQLVRAIKYRTQLNLNTDQINQLLKANNTLEILQRNYKPVTSENAFNPKTYEGEQLTKVLNNEQYNSFLTLAVQARAQADCDDAFFLLKKLVLIKSADTAAMYKQAMGYFMKVDINDARVLNSKAPEKLDSIRKTYFSFKPVFLMELDFFNNKFFPKSQFADVIKKRKELEISGDQSDALFENITKLEQLKLAFASAKPTERYDQQPFEVENLSKILNQVQYKKYLFYKDKSQAAINEKTDWDKIKQFGLANEADSAKVAKLNFNYELNKLVANELYHIEDSPQNAQFKSKTEADKPQILKDLDATLKTTASNKDVKKSLAW